MEHRCLSAADPRAATQRAGSVREQSTGRELAKRAQRLDSAQAAQANRRQDRSGIMGRSCVGQSPALLAPGLVPAVPRGSTVPGAVWRAQMLPGLVAPWQGGLENWGQSPAPHCQPPCVPPICVPAPCQGWTLFAQWPELS